MTVATEITRLQQAKADIKTSIESKGVTVSSDATLDEYSALIDNIEVGKDITWFGGVEPTFLYETTASWNLSDMNFSSLTPSTSNQYMTYPTTTYTTTASTLVYYDRWGSGYNDGSILDFANYNYIVLSDAYVETAYTSSESNMGIPHVVTECSSSIMHIGQRVRSSSSTMIYPTSTTYGTSTVGSYTLSGVWYRTSLGVLVMANNCTYGYYIGWAAPAISSTSSLTASYITFRSPYWGIRTSSTYMHTNAWAKVDADNTTLNIRQRLYRVEKPGVYEEVYNRIGYMLENNAFPSESV